MISLRDIGKSYGGVRALDLDGVTLEIEPGTVHCLVGENGAGKSTLGKVIAGAVVPDQGEVLVDGVPVVLRSPHDALRHGLTMIAQELALLPARSVLDNVYLGREPNVGGVVRRRRQLADYRTLCERAGFTVPADVPVGALRPAEQVEVEVLRALAREARLIVFDEPTAALTPGETEVLFRLIRSLRDAGTAIVYVSHRMEEIFALGDTITVLKDGRHVQTTPAAEVTPSTLVTAMLGRTLDRIFPPRVHPPADAPAVLEVEGLSRHGVLDDISFSVRAGEIVGIAGLVGSGRSELARSIFGADPRDAGTVRLDGEVLRIGHPKHAIRSGIAMLPESRKTQGLFMQRSIAHNTTIAHLDAVSSAGLISRSRERRKVARSIADLDVRAPSAAVPVSTLSGGNQQKVLLGRWLLERPRVLIVDEPTHGVDIGAKHEIYERLAGLAQQGIGIVVISSELTEILELSHRILVMARGRLVAELAHDATEEDVLRAAFETAATP